MCHWIKTDDVVALADLTHITCWILRDDIHGGCGALSAVDVTVVVTVAVAVAVTVAGVPWLGAAWLVQLGSARFTNSPVRAMPSSHDVIAEYHVANASTWARWPAKGSTSARTWPVIPSCLYAADSVAMSTVSRSPMKAYVDTAMSRKRLDSVHLERVPVHVNSDEPHMPLNTSASSREHWSAL